MLKDSLYTTRQLSENDNLINATVALNAAHEIFIGHFPVRAVLPGACMLQMIKEILELSFSAKLQLVKADDIKFLRMIEPGGNAAVDFTIEYDKKEADQFSVNASISKAHAVCYKMKASYKKV